MLVLPGTQALSAFKAQALLQQVQAAVPSIEAVSTRAVHFVQIKPELDQASMAEFLTNESTPERQILKAMFTSPSSVPSAASIQVNGLVIRFSRMEYGFEHLAVFNSPVN